MKAFQPRLLGVVIIIIVLLVALQNKFVQSPQVPPSPTVQVAQLPQPQVRVVLLSSNGEPGRAAPDHAIIPTAGALGPSPEAILLEKTPAQVDGNPTPAATLATFLQEVANGHAARVRGLLIPGLPALRVVQQPVNDNSFVSVEDGTATQFQSAVPYGVIGLLAHNFLSGKLFFQIARGQELAVMLEDGSQERFQVVEITDFERLTKNDLQSDFRELSNDQTLSADQVFKRYYQGQPHLTLQTCVEKNGDYNWGVRFITAVPIP
jgi:hypothetical protein